MTINRNNYEEFFLLYVDNELSAREKNAVDVFLTENPDLQEEMLMLQQSILIPDDAVFTDKESLLKPETIDSKMQEQLILMLDNELDKKAKANLLKSIETDAAAKQEWEILQQTKLSAEDSIIFKDKAILYKEEGGRVISIKWWRIAAAALLIGFGVWGVLNYSNKAGDIEPGNTATTAPVKSSAPKEIVPQNINKQPAVTNKIESNDATAVNTTIEKKEKKSTVAEKVKNSIVNNKEQQEVLPVKDIAQQKQAIQPPSNNLPKPLENINNNDRNNNDVVIVPPSNSIKSEPDVLQPKETTPDNSVVMVKFSEDENGGEDENDGKNRKSRIGGFFKKLKRVVERKTNVKTGDDKSFKIANMSFAMQ